ncbi:phospholipase A2 inhibitor NAI-like [Rhineura floridana]|uniref:phospholipase A2 inhibitor NAI-like n=1 Tax=Rhineura floridana TaxID=261503 RepID=UPI002AC829B1|nr:phospholipase A2 inhibitor NAI-like [Rhineura floridana]
MQILLGIFLGFLLITTGASLECEVCIGIGYSCTGRMQTCEAGKDTCFVTVVENLLGEFPIQTVVKGCGFSSDCNLGPQYMNFGHGQEVRTEVACCVGEACRTASAQLPPRITKTNGKQCPACYSLISGGCNPHEVVNCVGPQNDCLDLAATVTYGTVVINTVQKGCVTRGVCSDSAQREPNMAGISYSITKAECKPALQPE